MNKLIKLAQYESFSEEIKLLSFGKPLKSKSNLLRLSPFMDPVDGLLRIEGILNSRPLYPMSPDPNDFQSLTPSHFLIGKSLITIPDSNVMDLQIGRLSRYQLLQQINQQFWKRWSRDYLSQLQQKSKWSQQSSSLAVGDLVLVKQDNLPPYQWLLARVVQLHPGEDNVVRVATVKTKNGILKRAVSRTFDEIEEEGDEVEEENPIADNLEELHIHEVLFSFEDEELAKPGPSGIAKRRRMH
ncbi:uncharacterized protein LOC111691767 [Anoplophora glabripennis]|uniref:uncharacterized protein LOC111691767 n=1 Tax=Anoplophora glabripennis TaxID=217634 RepID=UPI000C76C506|nr:uncharacterized protein LOC111691767 [Anoplophora glabripennis]